MDLARQRQIKRWNNGREFEIGIWGQPVFNMLRDVQQEEVVDELGIAERDGFAGPYNAQVSGRVVKNYSGPLRGLILNKMKLGSSARITRVGEDAGATYVPLIPEIRGLHRDLINAAAKIGGSGESRPGRDHVKYIMGFRYVIGDQALTRPPTNEDVFTVIGIANVAPQAATLEVISWPRVMRKVYTRWKTRAAQKGFDIRLRYLQGSSIPYLKLGKRVDPLREVVTRGDEKGRITTRSRVIQYATPIIEIAPLGTFTNKKTGPYNPRNCRRMGGAKSPMRCRRIFNSIRNYYRKR